MRRHDRPGVPVDQAVGLEQGPQRLGEHLLADALGAAAQLAPPQRLALGRARAAPARPTCSSRGRARPGSGSRREHRLGEVSSQVVADSPSCQYLTSKWVLTLWEVWPTPVVVASWWQPSTTKGTPHDPSSSPEPAATSAVSSSRPCSSRGVARRRDRRHRTHARDRHRPRRPRCRRPARRLRRPRRASTRPSQVRTGVLLVSGERGRRSGSPSTRNVDRRGARGRCRPRRLHERSRAPTPPSMLLAAEHRGHRAS